MEKTYVLDTSVLLQTPYALEAFEDNQIVLPIAVLEELDALKKDVRRTNLFRRCGLIQEYRLLVGSVSC